MILTYNFKHISKMKVKKIVSLINSVETGGLYPEDAGGADAAGGFAEREEGETEEAGVDEIIYNKATGGMGGIQ